jgi:SAM-dependent methyltransferase
MSELNRERRHWEQLAASDPMWVILTEPGREGRWTPEDFFESGREEIASLFGQLAEMHQPIRPGIALDFGCGLGRLTQALCARFERVYGIDISERMIEGAKAHNRCGDRAMYYANAVDRLPMLASGTVDFIYSRLVLQHIPRDAQESYIAEFGRVLGPGGLAVFQVLTRAHNPAVRARHWIRNQFPTLYRVARDMVSRKARWELNPIPEARVIEILNRTGVRPIRIISDDAGSGVFESRTFFVEKSSG